jgi:hypothetical protein
MPGSTLSSWMQDPLRIVTTRASRRKWPPRIASPSGATVEGRPRVNVADELGDAGRVMHVDPSRCWPGAGLAPGECVEFSLCARHLLPARVLGTEEDANVEQMFVAASEEDELRHVCRRLSLPASVVTELGQLIRLLPGRRHRGQGRWLREPP